MDAVACEGSWLIRPTCMLCLVKTIRCLDVDWAGSGCCGVLYDLNKTNWVYALGTPIGGYGFWEREIPLVDSDTACVPRIYSENIAISGTGF